MAYNYIIANMIFFKGTHTALHIRKQTEVEVEGGMLYFPVSMAVC